MYFMIGVEPCGVELLKREKIDLKVRKLFQMTFNPLVIDADSAKDWKNKKKIYISDTN